MTGAGQDIGLLRCCCRGGPPIRPHIQYKTVVLYEIDVYGDMSDLG